MVESIVVGKSERIVTAVLQAVHCMAKARCTVIGNIETRKLRWSSLCADHIHLDFDGAGDDAAVAQINTICAQSPDTVVIPADCAGVRMINRVRHRLQARIVPIPEPATLDLMDDKWRFHQFCETNEIAVPATVYVGTKDDLDFARIESVLGLPFVLKPANESGSLGVRIVSSREHFEKTILQDDGYRFRTLIAQRYIEGEDIDASLLASRGTIVALAIQQLRGPAIEFLARPDLEAMVASLCRASGYDGVMHVDARIESATGRVFLIESNPRFWASLTAAIWCGLNFVAESIQPAPGASGMQRLICGRAHTRHPLLRPSSWPTLLRDTGQPGRLGRAAVLDVYLLGQFTGDLPLMAARYIGTRAAKGLRSIARPSTARRVSGLLPRK